MEWKTLLAYITGSVDQELLLRNEYLVAENRVLRSQIPRPVRRTDGERETLADLGKRHRQSPGRPRVDQDLEDVVVRMAQENRSWGYDRMVGALAN